MKKKSILHFIHSRFIFQLTMFLQFFKFVFSISFLAWFLLYYDDWLLLSPLPVRAQIVLTLTLSRTFTAHPQFVYQFFLVASHRKKKWNFCVTLSITVFMLSEYKAIFGHMQKILSIT